MENKILINYSNHPYDYWDSKQKEAAQTYGKVIDIPFPKVNEKEDETYIEQLAEKCMLDILSQGNKTEITVHLMGELTLTFALLKRLQKLGIRCIASTSKRMVKEEVSGKKEEVIFIFERFREYR